MYNSHIHGKIAGTNNLEPRSTEQVRVRNGENRVVYFVRFNVWVEKQTRWEDDPQNPGKRRRPRELVQVILPEHQDRHKVFHYLEPGRKVLVVGDQDHRPGFGKPTNETMKAYANPVIFAGSNGVHLLDSQWSVTATRVLSYLQNHNILEEEQGKELITAVKYHFSEDNPNRSAPRIYETLSDEERTRLLAVPVPSQGSQQQGAQSSTGF